MNGVNGEIHRGRAKAAKFKSAGPKGQRSAQVTKVVELGLKAKSWHLFRVPAADKVIILNHLALTRGSSYLPY